MLPSLTLVVVLLLYNISIRLKRGAFVIMSETVNTIEDYTLSLCQKARELGASQAVALPVADIVVDERTALKCLVPICSHYGVDLMCPPNVPPVSKFKEMLKHYRRAVLIGVEIPLEDPPANRKRRSEKPRDKYRHILRGSKKKLLEIVEQIESSCMGEGYHFAAGLLGGSCPLCKECVGVKSGLPCRHPFKARPSMEAMGISVVATARKAGVDLNFKPDGDRKWVGLVLVD